MPTPIFVLSLVAQGAMLALLVMVLLRALHKRFPVFVVYCLSIQILEPVRDLYFGQPTRYFYLYWITEAWFLIVAFFAMLSVLRPLTQLEYVRHPWSRFLLLPFASFIVAAASWTVFVRPIGRTVAGRFASAVYIFVIMMSIAELLLFIISFRVRRRAIEWTLYEFGILKGFGALACLKLIAYSVLVLRLFHFNVTPQLESLFRAFPVGAFIASATVWLITFSKPEPTRPTTPDMGSFADALKLLLEQYEAQAEFVRKIGKHLDNRFMGLGSSRSLQND